MRSLKTFRTALLAALAAQFLMAAVPADAQFFHVSVRKVDTVRDPFPLRVSVAVNTNRFYFLTPDGFAVADDSAQNRVILTGDKNASTVVVRFGDPYFSDGKYVDADTCRSLVRERFMDAKITAESESTIAHRTGPVFEFQCTLGGLTQSAKIAFIPSSAGVIEVTAFGSGNVSSRFKTVMLSFEEGEHPDSPPADDKF